MENFLKSKENQMKKKIIIKLLEGMKYWTKKTIIEEDEKLNKVRIANKKKKEKEKEKKRCWRCSA